MRRESPKRLPGRAKCERADFAQAHARDRVVIGNQRGGEFAPRSWNWNVLFRKIAGAEPNPSRGLRLDMRWIEAHQLERIVPPRDRPVTASYRHPERSAGSPKGKGLPIGDPSLRSG